MNVLIVEDDKNLARILTSELLGEGFEVEAADAGRKALDRVETDEYDVVLLDLNLPDRNGLDVLRDFKNLEVSAEVIILTGNGTVSTAVEAMKLGAYDFLTKPFELEEL
jgi:DNA-binding response OmpR family regulator